MHTDAVQACGRIPIDLDDMQVDLLSLSGHKICGPKGTGILFVRKGTDLSPMLFGGGQEKGIRPGTQDVAGAVGISKAIELSVDEQENECIRLAQLRDTLEEGLSVGISNLKVYGKEGARAPHILNVGIADLDSDALLANLDMKGISVSSGSACNSGISSKSHVLKAIYNNLEKTAIVRFSLGLSTTLQEIQETITTTQSIVLNMKTH
jgi:cysteine desulfurase